MRIFKVLPPLAMAAVLSTFAFAMSEDDIELLRPYLNDFEELCEDALDTRRCDAIDDIGDYRREGKSREKACDNLIKLVDRCEDDLDAEHVTCRLFEVLQDDFCQADDDDDECGRVVPNEVLSVDERVTSCDGRFVFVMQGDGNLVLYQGRSPLWSSNTQGNPGSTAVMQGDGNLVVYSPSRVPLWNSETFGNPGASLVVQNDGNVVIYATDGNPLWDTETCCR